LTTRDPTVTSEVLTMIEAFGTTGLDQQGNNYFLLPIGGLAIELSYAGAPVVAGQFGQWVPIGTEQTVTGFEVAWKMTGADQYTVWNTDSSGNYLSSVFDYATGSSVALESFETSFQQDLNGDGVIGIPPAPPPTIIEAFGTTALEQQGNNYILAPTGGSAVELSYAGAPVVAGQFGQWVPIGTEQTVTGFEVAWKMTGADQYTVWNTDSSGNYLSSVFDYATGSSVALESFETSFQQDLNGDGVIGIPPAPPPTIIEAFGTTSLEQQGNNYILAPTGGSAVELSYAGAPVVAGQFGQWVPIGTEQTATGFEVAWKMTGADQYTVWNTDSSGNYLSSVFDYATGSSVALESFEVSFQQDLNGDGVTGVPPAPPPAIIEAFGTTSLEQQGNNYLLAPTDGAAVELSYGGAPVVAGQFGQWVPIGTEQTATGFEVAWKMTGADQYTVWNTDSSGNYLSSVFDSATGSSIALESFETSFQQDLNGDGVIGIPPAPPPTIIEAFGTTSLDQQGNNYLLAPTDGAAVELSYGGAHVVAGQFGQWVPIGTEQTATGFEVAWKMTGADQYTVWNTDNSGNYLSSDFVSATGSSVALQSLEASFQQDLNGDGTIGLAAGLGLGDTPQFIYEGTDANGVQLYDVTWPTMGDHPFAVRVLAPNNPSANYSHSFLYALPVEPGITQPTYGSGLDQLEQLNIQNQYNTTIIEPIFPIDSWYADNPLDPTINYDTFMATFLPAWADSTLSTSGGAEQNLLIGFSKSGYGAMDLLFKNPTVFNAAAAWDFPADMTSYDQFGTSSSNDYGTAANFQDNYQLTSSFIDALKAPFTTADRIWISGYQVFQTDIAAFDALLTSEGVSHTLAPQTYAAHDWSGGWLSGAVAGLYGLEQDLIGTVPVPAAASLSPSSGTVVNAATAPIGAALQQPTAIPLLDSLLANV
jgi:20S proteasome alpha/beta subunit